MAQNVTKEATLSAKQQKAVAALLGAPNVEAAAGIAGVTPRTIWRWLSDDPLFVEEYRKARQRAVDTAVASLQGCMAEAVQTLRNNLSSRSAPIQVRSAIALLELGLKAHEAFDLAGRIEELERNAPDSGSYQW
jgi:hypothetical protein